MTAKRFASAVVALALLATAHADAQEPATTARAAARESVAKGGRFFTQAEKKHDRSLYEAAYLQYAQAFAIFPDDRVLWNLAVCEIRTDRFIEGLDHLRTYDAHLHVLAQASHPDHAMLTALLKEGNAATGHLAIDAPAGAVVSVDGKGLATHAPIVGPVDVQPGDHVVTAQLDAKSARVVITTPAGGDDERTSRVRRRRASAPCAVASAHDGAGTCAPAARGHASRERDEQHAHRARRLCAWSRGRRARRGDRVSGSQPTRERGRSVDVSNGSPPGAARAPRARRATR